MVGPTIQPDIFSHILKFRIPKIVFIADIEKMYRMIALHPDDWHFNRIVWRFDPSKPLQDYFLTTVTYGLANSAFMAIRSLLQLAKDEGHKYPLGKKVVEEDFYVDNLQTGANTLEKALEIKCQVQDLLNKGCFPLKKWVSNSEEFLATIPPEDRDYSIPFELHKDDTIKSLGVQWNPVEDNFIFRSNWELYTDLSKRNCLSNVSKIYDPLGWLSPFIVSAKILIQKLWIIKTDWDSILPENIAKAFQNFQNQLQDLENIKIPRWLQNNIGKITLFGFCDASESACAAAVYWHSIDQNGQVNSNLVASKTKVAPLKRLSLARLELIAAEKLAQLVKKITLVCKDIDFEIQAFTDSTIVLSWLSQEPYHWKTFVANRVTKIQEILPFSTWSHVTSEENPADAASRGISLMDLANHKLWWHGPEWLKNPVPKSPSKFNFNQSALDEGKDITVCLVDIKENGSFVEKFSSYFRLKRAVANSIRILRNARLPKSDRNFGPLKVEDLENSETILLKLVQKEDFPNEIQALSNSLPLAKNSPLKSLYPFLDSKGLLRVGGRLTNSNLSYDIKHPIIIDGKNHIATILVRDLHLQNLHAGPSFLMSHLNRKFHILGCRNLVRKITRTCPKCIRYRAKMSEQLQGSLPYQRTNPSRPFLVCGLDYAGPFHLKLYKGRCQRVQKAWIAIFVCFTTKAIHLELVTELTSEAFLAALKRFVSRRGLCSDIFSDNGTNFVGGNRELIEVANFLSSTEFANAVPSYLVSNSIKWHFSPPSAPHFNGLAESCVKSVKNHLRRSIGDTRLTFEEFYTVLCQVEAVLNSRPIALNQSDSELDPLTPGHFLVGGPLVTVPERPLINTNANHLQRWKLVTRIQQDFWTRWQNEYLTTLQKRPKFQESLSNIQLDTIVLIKEDGLPPGKWVLGKIIDTHPGKDDKVRVVSIKTVTGIFKRPITKVCPLF